MGRIFLFFTLTSANRDDVIEKPIQKMPEKEKIFVVPVETNNEYHKEIGKQMQFSIRIKEILDSLPPPIRSKK